MWGAFEPRIGEIENMVNEHTSHGISANQDSEAGEFDYIAGFEVSGAKDVPPGIVRFEVPGAKCAGFATTLSTIGKTFHYAYQTWLPETPFMAACDPDLDVCSEAFDPLDSDSEFDLYVAIHWDDAHQSRSVALRSAHGGFMRDLLSLDKTWAMRGTDDVPHVARKRR